jgi:hypothetical protein
VYGSIFGIPRRRTRKASRILIIGSVVKQQLSNTEKDKKGIENSDNRIRCKAAAFEYRE